MRAVIKQEVLEQLADGEAKEAVVEKIVTDR
jgi:hypothetical protein